MIFDEKMEVKLAITPRADDPTGGLFTIIFGLEPLLEAALEGFRWFQTFEVIVLIRVDKFKG